MKFPIVFFTIALLYAFNAKAEPFTPILSPEAEITMLTASPGDELYSVFGHSALRVHDPEKGVDLVFNYGTFDFNTPNFYMKFARGKLLYKVSAYGMHHFVPSYQSEGRAIYEQVLNLNYEEKQALFTFLMHNQLPENAYYHYDFFYDNCATRIRDVLDNLFDIEWETAVPGPEHIAQINALLDYEFVYEPEFAYPKSFRDLLQPFLQTMPWSRFGIDLALGLPADIIADPYYYMFLPDEMLIGFALARKADGSPLVADYRMVIPKTEDLSPAGLVTPLLVFWVLFFLGLLSFAHAKLSRVFDLFFFTSLGVLGLGVVFLWFFPDHITTGANMNILWAIPFHLYFIWKARYWNSQALVKLYFKITAALAFVILLTWVWFPQDYNEAFFPIILLVLLKSIPYAFVSGKVKAVFSELPALRVKEQV